MSTQFYNELYANTLSNIDTRRAKQEEERRYQYQDLESVISRFEDTIMYNCRDKMFDASQNGHFYATLYSFTNMDMFDNYKIVFLLKGPYRSTFFDELGVVPLLTRLRTTFDPIDIYLSYNRMTRTHHLMASWKS
jgi:hypothetical protein